GPGARRASGVHGDGRPGDLSRPRPPCHAARGARSRRRVPRVSVPDRDRRREQRRLPQGGDQRDACRARAGGARRDGGARATPAEARAGRDGSELPQPAGQRGLLRRREEAQRDPPDGCARAHARDPGRDRLGARHRRAEDRRAGREPPAAPRQRHHPGVPLPAHPPVRRARSRPRALRRPHREVGGQGAGARARAQRLRLDQGRGGGCPASRRPSLTTALARTHRYLGEFETLDRRDATGAPAWLSEMGRAAMARFAERGFPTTRDEDWRYTNLAPLAATPLHAPSSVAPDPVSAELVHRVLIGSNAWPRLVFVDGRYAPEHSSVPALPGGTRLSSLAQAMVDHEELVERHLAKHVRWDDNVFAALSTAFVRDGAFLYVPAETVIAAPIELAFLTTRPGVLAQPRILVVAGPHSRFTVVERHVGLT